MDHKNRNTIWYSVLIAIVLLVALAGYLGYVLYPRFDLPSVTGAGLLLLAAVAGVASFFTPCSFPLLTALLGRSIHTEGTDGTDDAGRPLDRAVRYGAVLAAGASLFLLLVGVGIALGGGALFRQITFTSTAGRILRLILGSLLILFGGVQVGLLSLPFDKVTALATPIRRFQVTIRNDHPAAGFFVFGFGYILAGFG